MSLKRTTKISIISATVIIGAALGLRGLHAWWPALGLLMLVGLALRRSRLGWLVLVGLALWLGVWRGQVSLAHKQYLQSLVGQKVVLTAVINDDPGASTKTMSFVLANTQMEGRPLPGKISVTTFPMRLQRGHSLVIEGRIKPGFGSTDAKLAFPKITVVSTDQGWLERLRQRFFAGMRTALPEPQASFGLGLLVGVRALIPKDLQLQLTAVGLSHLVAVSGYNLTIIVNAVRNIFGRFSYNATLVLTGWLIAGFVVVSGGSASIVRAALVASLSLVASSRGRQFHPLNLILGTAAITAAWKPAYLYDLGWMLSYLAFFGILVLAPAIQARLAWKKRAGVSMFIETVSAQIMTTPLIMLIFGNLSIVAPFSNVFVLPLVPLAMLLCFIAGIIGMLLPAFVGWVAWPAVLLLGLMLAIVQAFASLKFASVTQYLSLTHTIIIYVLLAVLTAIIMSRVKIKTKPTI